jgi:hypothetical protein
MSERALLFPLKTKTTSFRGQASWSKMMSPGGKLTALAYHPNRKVNKAEELTYLSTNIYIKLLKYDKEI